MDDLRAAITAAPVAAVLIAVNLEVVTLPPHWEGVLAQPWTLLTVFFPAEATGFDERAGAASAAFLGLIGALAACPRDTSAARLPVDRILIIVLIVPLAPVAGIGDWVSSTARLAGIEVGAACGYGARTLVNARRAVTVAAQGPNRAPPRTRRDGAFGGAPCAVRISRAVRQP